MTSSFDSLPGGTFVCFSFTGGREEKNLEMLVGRRQVVGRVFVRVDCVIEGMSECIEHI